MNNESLSSLELLNMLQSLAEILPEDESDDDSVVIDEAKENEREDRRRDNGNNERNEHVESKKSAGNLQISSIKEAEFLVDTRVRFGMSGLGSKVVDYIIDPKNHVYGDPDEYHNIISSFLRMGDYYNAHRICAYALQSFPYSVDILANAIRSSCEFEDFNVTEAYIAAAQKIDKRFWNWRLFLYTIKAYRNRMCKCESDELGIYYDKAIELTKAFQKCIPWDERGYNQMAELLLQANDVASARRVLDKAIFSGYEDADKTVKPLVAPQCCVTMLNEILDDTIEYNKIQEVAIKGIQYTAQEQPSSQIGYFVYRLAMAMDAELVKDNYKSKSDIETTLRMYQCAYDLNGDRSYAETIKIRFSILAQNRQNPVENAVLVKRSLTKKQTVE